MSDRRAGTTPVPRELLPLDAAGVLWVAAIDRVPLSERIEWVKTMEKRVAEINSARAKRVLRAV